VRYPQAFPPPAARFDLASSPAAVGLLDHIFHPLSVIQFLGGDATTLLYQRDERAGGVFALLGLREGGVACLHSVGGQGRHAPLERVEIVGQGAHLVIENGVKLTYYRPGQPLPYGRAPSFIAPDDEAPLHWEPEFSLGVLSNDNAVLLGYVPEVRAFCQSVLSNTPPERAGLRDARQMMRIYEAFRQPAGRTIDLTA
jgi:predicted dehydrogenase